MGGTRMTGWGDAPRRLLARAGGLTALLGVVACGGPSSEQELAAAEAAFHEASRDSTWASGATALLGEFLRQHPQDPQAARVLKLLAVLRQQLGDMDGAITHYQRLLDEYPDSEYADEAQFMLGFIYEEHLRDYPAARTAYQRLIDRYPDSDLVRDARQLLEHVGRPAEEWVRFQDTDAP